jgi:hypothetical protein
MSDCSSISKTTRLKEAKNPLIIVKILEFVKANNPFKQPLFVEGVNNNNFFAKFGIKK